MQKISIAILCCALWSHFDAFALPADLTGKRLKVTGRWNGKYLEVERFRERDPDRDPLTGRVEGRIDTISLARSAFVVGPLVVKVTTATRFVDLSPRALARGVSVEAIGRLAKPGLLIAEAIEPGAAAGNVIELLGAVTANLQYPSGEVHARVLGVPVRMAQEVFDRGLSLIRHPDDKRPDRQLTMLFWGKPLIIGGEFGTDLNYRGDYRLDRAAQDDEARLDNGLELEFFFRAAKNFSVFAEVKSSREQIVYDQAQEGGLESRIQRGEMWFFAGRLFGTPFAVQLGRQNFREEREWWWDSDLDAARLYYAGRRVYGEVAVAEELQGLHFDSQAADPEKMGILRYLARFSLAYNPGHRFDLFYLQQRDRSGWPLPREVEAFEPEDPADADLLWRGLRLSGEFDLGFAGDIEYWIDTASLGGKETYFDAATLTVPPEPENRSTRGPGRGDPFAPTPPGVLRRKISAWAYDAGLSWTSKLPLEPTFSISYAVGSGGESREGGLDASFRQSGLHDNNSKYSGVDRFRYYGELFRPDLSNIRIFTASLGFPIWRSSSVELLFHKYRQYALSTSRNSRLKARPNGRSRALGQEFNLVVGLEKWRHSEIEIVWGVFAAGNAYGPLAGKLAYNSIVKFNYNF